MAYALWGFPLYVTGTLAVLSPLWALRTLSPCPFWQFFPRIRFFFFFFTCTDLFSAEDSKETFWKSPGLSLFAALSFMWHSPLHPAVSALYYNLQGLANLASEFSTVYFIWESLLGPIWAPPCCVVAWKLSSAVCGGNHQPHHLVCFPISGITALC